MNFGRGQLAFLLWMARLWLVCQPSTWISFYLDWLLTPLSLKLPPSNKSTSKFKNTDAASLRAFLVLRLKEVLVSNALFSRCKILLVQNVSLLHIPSAREHEMRCLCFDTWHICGSVCSCVCSEISTGQLIRIRTPACGACIRWQASLLALGPSNFDCPAPTGPDPVWDHREGSEKSEGSTGGELHAAQGLCFTHLV